MLLGLFDCKNTDLLLAKMFKFLMYVYCISLYLPKLFSISHGKKSEMVFEYCGFKVTFRNICSVEKIQVRYVLELYFKYV